MIYLIVCTILNLNIIAAEPNCVTVPLSSSLNQIAFTIRVNTTKEGKITGYFEEFEKYSECLTLVLNHQSGSENKTFFTGQLNVKYQINQIEDFNFVIFYHQNSSKLLYDDVNLGRGGEKKWNTFSRRLAFDWTKGVSIVE